VSRALAAPRSLARAGPSVRPRTVTVVATWTGTYAVDGSAPRPITGNVRRSATVQVPVFESRSELVSGPA